MPVSTNGQDLVGLTGAAMIESRQPGGIVSVRADTQFSDFGASFIVAVQNKTEGAADFGPQNISATVDGKALRGAGEGGTYTVAGHKLTFSHLFNVSGGSAVTGMPASPKPTPMRATNSWV